MFILFLSACATTILVSASSADYVLYNTNWDLSAGDIDLSSNCSVGYNTSTPQQIETQLAACDLNFACTGMNSIPSPPSQPVIKACIDHKTLGQFTPPQKGSNINQVFVHKSRCNVGFWSLVFTRKHKVNIL